VLLLMAVEPLSDIVNKYRALITAQENYKRLQQEIAHLFLLLSPEQQQSYIAACERIDNEEK